MPCFSKKNLQVLWLVALIAVLGSLSYFNTFDAPFVYDDTNYIVSNPLIKDFDYFIDSSLVDLESERSYLTHSVTQFFRTRCVGYLSLWASYRIGGLNVTGYHVTNLFIHLLNSLLVYLIMVLTFRTPGVRIHVFRGYSHFIALICGLLFVAHPLQTEAVTYIIQRVVLLAAMFYLASIASYIGARLLMERKLAEHPSSYSRLSTISLLLYCLAVLFAILGMKTKENVFTLPIMILLHEIMFFKGTVKRRLLYLIPLLITMLIIPLTYVDMNMNENLTTVLENSTKYLNAPPRLDYFITQFNVTAKYIRLLVFPVGQNIDHDQHVYQSFFEPQVFFSFLFLVSVLSLGIYFFWKSRATNLDPGFGAQHSEVNAARSNYLLRLSAFGIFWLFITLSVESSVLPIGEIMVEYRVYLPSTGFFIAMVTTGFAFFNQMWNRKIKKISIAIVALVIIVLAGATCARNTVWQSDISLWEDAINKSPQKARGHINLALAYMSKGLNEKAISHLLTSLDIDPQSHLAHNNLGNVFRSIGQPDKAILHYKTALKLNPGSLVICSNLAKAYFDKGLIDKALEYNNMALMIKPNYAETHNSLGNAYKAKGLREKAIDHYKKALMIKPDYAEAYNNIAIIYASKGQADIAIEHLHKALLFRPDYAEAHNNIALLYGFKGNTEKTIDHLKKSLELKPDYVEAHYNLGLTYMMTGHMDKAGSEFKAALNIDPNYQKAIMHLKRIEKDER